MEHRHRRDEEVLTLVLHLQPLGLPLDELHAHPVEEIPIDGTIARDRAEWIRRELGELRSCVFCRDLFDSLWREEEGGMDRPEGGDGSLRPDVLPIQRKDFRRRPPKGDASGEAASPSPEERPCEITCSAQGMLVRILAERDGGATAVLLLAEGSPEGVVLRVDGDEVEFSAAGVLRLPSMPVRIGLERRPPRPGTEPAKQPKPAG